MVDSRIRGIRPLIRFGNRTDEKDGVLYFTANNNSKIVITDVGFYVLGRMVGDRLNKIVHLPTQIGNGCVVGLGVSSL